MVAHEFGHFIIAKVNGIHVVEFAVGMGPTLLSFEKNGTKYSLKLLPIGGACMFEGEDGREEATDGQNQDEQSSDSINEKGKYGKSFPEAPVFARIATVIAGPIFNFILAFFLFSGLALAPGFSLSAGSFTDYYYTMAERQPALYTLMMALQFGAVCACCSSFGLLLSAFQPNAFVSTGIGGLTFFCAVSYIPNRSMFSILRIITMNPVLPLGNETPQWLSFLWGMMVPLAVTALCMWGFYRRLEWRQENGRL